RAVHTVLVQVGKARIVAIALECFLRFPFHENHHLAPWAALSRLAKPPERHDPAAMRLDFLRRALGIREVLVLVGDVEEIEGVTLAHGRPGLPPPFGACDLDYAFRPAPTVRTVGLEPIRFCPTTPPP